MRHDDRGFSLVELIIVIAIMAVLVGVLAPQFIKYVESSRRAKDIHNANEIRDAVLAALANGDLTEDISGGVGFKDISDKVKDISSGNVMDVKVAATPFKDDEYKVYFNYGTNQIKVTVAGYDLTTDTGAAAYKDATAAYHDPELPEDP